MRKISYATSDKEEWNKRTSKIKASVIDDYSHPFDPIFSKYLPKNKRFECLEIGSIPGNFLIYFHKRFGYRITGIDFADNPQLFYQTMKKNKIKYYNFISADFFKHKFESQYDVVTSFGFIEHFDNVRDVLKKHIDLIKPGGYLVITLPNFRFLQHIYHYMFDKPNLNIHNLKAMRLGYLKLTLLSLGMRKLFAGYWGNLQVWREETDLTLSGLRRVNALHRWVAKHGHKLPNSRLYSPFIVLVYRKKK